jgi:hypothetical protein
LTFTLPYAGATRIRFEGLPAICQALSLPRTDTPSIGSTHNKGLLPSQIPIRANQASRVVTLSRFASLTGKERG